MSRSKAFFINGGAGRVIASIPALEKYAETHDDFVLDAHLGFYFVPDSFKICLSTYNACLCCRTLNVSNLWHSGKFWVKILFGRNRIQRDIAVVAIKV